MGSCWIVKFSGFCEPDLKLLILWNHPWGTYAHHENWKLVRATSHVRRLLNLFWNITIQALGDVASACPLFWPLQIPLSFFSLSSSNRSFWSSKCWTGFCFKPFNLFLSGLIFSYICTWLISSHSDLWWNIKIKTSQSFFVMLPYLCYFIVLYRLNFFQLLFFHKM